jgi:hypothetical protein
MYSTACNISKIQTVFSVHIADKNLKDEVVFAGGGARVLYDATSRRKMRIV